MYKHVDIKPLDPNFDAGSLFKSVGRTKVFSSGVRRCSFMFFEKKKRCFFVYRSRITWRPIFYATNGCQRMKAYVVYKCIHTRAQIFRNELDGSSSPGTPAGVIPCGVCTRRISYSAARNWFGGVYVFQLISARGFISPYLHSYSDYICHQWRKRYFRLLSSATLLRSENDNHLRAPLLFVFGPRRRIFGLRSAINNLQRYRQITSIQHPLKRRANTFCISVRFSFNDFEKFE